MAYNRTLEGPDPDSSFLVRAGLVAVVGPTETVVLPAGAIWPGTAALPPDLMEWLRPARTYLSQEDGAVPWVASPREAEFTGTLVLAQWLRDTAPVRTRLARLGQLVEVEAHSHVALAAMLGVHRETMTFARSGRRSRGRDRNAAD